MLFQKILVEQLSAVGFNCIELWGGNWTVSCLRRTLWLQIARSRIRTLTPLGGQLRHHLEMTFRLQVLFLFFGCCAVKVDLLCCVQLMHGKLREQRVWWNQGGLIERLPLQGEFVSVHKVNFPWLHTWHVRTLVFRLLLSTENNLQRRGEVKFCGVYRDHNAGVRQVMRVISFGFLVLSCLALGPAPVSFAGAWVVNKAIDQWILFLNDLSCARHLLFRFSRFGDVVLMLF